MKHSEEDHTTGCSERCEPKGGFKLAPFVSMREEGCCGGGHKFDENLQTIPLTTLDQVKEFHQAFGHPVKDVPDLSDRKLNDLRVNLLVEEVKELNDAMGVNDTVAALDALLDIQYVLDGAFLALGFHNVKDEGFDRVHQSNMSKLGEDGKPVLREDGKILKGPNYKKVDLTDLV